MRSGDCGVQISSIDLRGRSNITDSKERDLLSIQHGEKARLASIASGFCNSHGLDFFLDQSRCAILQGRRPKIERVIICQAHGMKSSAAKQVCRGYWSAECITLRRLAEI